MCLTACSLAYVQTCLYIFCRHPYVCQGAKCVHTSEHIFCAFSDQQKIRQPGKTMEGHGYEKVQLLRTIHQYAEQVLEQAQQKNMAKKWKKKCGSYKEGERESLQSPCFGLPTYCWLLVVRKWERARFSPPENNIKNPQSSNQTHNPRHRKPFWSVKPPNGSSIWMLWVCAALLAPFASPSVPSRSLKVSTTT